MAANHHRLKNLIAIVDCNGVQINGWTNDVMTVEPIADKWRSFGWKTVEVNGHNMKDLLTALHTAKTMRHPTAILMRTVKGKGVSFMEDDAKWHGAAPSEEELLQAIVEIKEGGVV
jgi:transketolase